MKKIVLASLVGLTFAFAAVAGDKDKAASGDKMMKKDMMITMSKDAKWMPMDPNNPAGPMISPINGDMKGPSHFLLKVPAGFKGGVHSHTADYSAVVVMGDWAHGLTEADAKVMTVGSSWVQPGKQDHYDACMSKTDCVAAIYVQGPMDYVPAAMAATPAKGKK
jgi:hypothetical protein